MKNSYMNFLIVLFNKFCLLFFRATQFLKYFCFSRHSKGYGIHSTFVYNFILNTFKKKVSMQISSDILRFRNDLYSNNTIVSSQAFGASNNSARVVVSKLAHSSSSRIKYLKLLVSIINYMNYTDILELGSCCGLSAAAMGISSSNVNVYTVEGDEYRFNIAKEYINKWKLNNINPICSDFNSVLDRFANSEKKFDLIFIDGDHSYKSTIKYFNKALQLLSENGVIVIDDINWSKGMKMAWMEIKSYDKVRLSIDVYQMGIIINLQNFAKQNFTIRY